jgi:hypothetical protein
LSYKLFDGNTHDDVTHIPNWNPRPYYWKILRGEACVFAGSPYFKNGGFFITIVPRERTEIKQFLKYLKENDVPWEDAFIEALTGKGGTNTCKHMSLADKEGYRIILFTAAQSRRRGAEDG